MTEDEAKGWIATRHGDAGVAAMEQIIALVGAEATQQNLVAPSTLGAMWNRHIVDSAQLLELKGVSKDGSWIDIGSGAGFPGLVVAALSEREMWLVEPRKKRAAFLEQAAMALGIAERTHIICGKIESASLAPARVISARAVGFLGDLLGWATPCATRKTQWVLPKGRTAREEVASARLAWHGVFHVEQSITDPDSMIVLASGVSRR